MKRYSLIILAFALLLGFTQCKPEPENNPDDSRMELRFEVPLNNGAKTDWNDFFIIDENGTGFIKNDIKWEDEETLYLAIPNLVYRGWGGNSYEKFFDATIITLEGIKDKDKGTITFSGKISFDDFDDKYSSVIFATDLTVYYLGSDSGTNVKHISEVNGTSCEGYEMYFDSQTGNKNDLGNVHFASIDVKLQGDYKDDGSPYIKIVPTYNYNFTTRTAICYLDLVGEKELTGTAVKENAVRFYCLNSEDLAYIVDSVKYNSYTTEFFTKDYTEGITLTETPSKESFIVIPPSDDAGMTLECDKGTYSFSNRIIANTIYYGKGVGNNKIEPLPWTPNP